MAGVKGRSGGRREGAGRKPRQPTAIAPDAAQAKHGEPLDPRPTLELVALGHIEVSAQQMKALVALLPYTNAKMGASSGKPAEPANPKPERFGVRQGPRLAAAGGRKV